jgi:phosphomannomutase/phosphoglucomutase
MKKLHKEFLQKFVESLDEKVCIDYSNGCGSIVFSDIIKGKIDAIEINKEIDGNFPSHLARTNRGKFERVKQTHKRKWIVFGVAFDGDADRIVFLDENGRVVRGDRILYHFFQVFKTKESCL